MTLTPFITRWQTSAAAERANYRLQLDDLRRDDVRELLRAVWLDPMSLDPSRRSARVTRDIADRLARLARSLEEAHPAERVAELLETLASLGQVEVLGEPETRFMVAA